MEMNNPYIPATKEDEQHLRRSRVTLWPVVWLCVLIIVGLIAAAWNVIGAEPTITIVIAVAIIGIVGLVGYGLLHIMGPADMKRCAEELPGNDILAPEDIRITAGKKYHYNCAPSDMYPYVAQLNLTKAGFYSFQVLERLFSFHIRNDYTIRPEWQQLQKGDWIYYHQNGAGTGIVDFIENEYITSYSDTRYKPTQELAIAWRPKWMKGFAWTWNFIFEPTDNGEGTRFLTYLQAWWPEDTSKLTIVRLLVQWGVPSIVMINGMAHKMGKLAEADAKARRAGKPRPGYNFTK